MTTEVHASLLPFDNPFAFREMLTHILSGKIHIESFADSKIVFVLIAKNGKTTERRRQIDVSAMRESYENEALGRIA